MGVETALLISAGISAGSSVLSGYQQRQTNRFQAEQAEADADAEKGAAIVRAEKIRKHTQSRAASARAALAANGASLDSESATLINNDIVKRGEEDAITGINDSLDAASRLRTSASTLRRAGNQALVAGIANAGSSVLNTTANYQAGWYGRAEG